MQVSVIKRIRIWGRVLWSLCRTFKGIDCHVLSAEETVNEILAGKSIIRFGDGEFGIYRGKDIHYQDWTPELKEKFVQIKETYERKKHESQYLLAVPQKFMQINSVELLKRRVWASSWAEARLFFKQNFDLKLIYGDAFVFEKKNRSIYGKIWQSKTNSNIIFVHNDEKYANSFAKRFAKRVAFVQCPPQNAFQDLEHIILECEKKIIMFNSEQEIKFVISAGPAGKVLAYYFTNKGYQCIDVGHCWDEPLESE